jgi:hypothetical protein
MPSIQKFTPFPKLPREIRNKIWGFAVLAQPNILQLHISSTDLLRISYSIPSLLQTNKEARDIAQNHYFLRLPQIEQALEPPTPILDIGFVPLDEQFFLGASVEIL